MHTTTMYLRGIVPAIVTPLRSSGELLDEECARKLADFLIAKGVHGLFALGSTGECAYLDIRIRQQMATVVVEETNGRVPVVIHVGAHTLQDVMMLASHAAMIGAAGIGIVPPNYYHMDDLALERYFSKVAEAVDIPIYLYNIPMNVKNAISVPLFTKLTQAYPHIVGMKDSSMNFDNFYDLVQAKKPHHSAIMGNDAQILPALTIGGQGAVSAGATAIPEPYLKLYDAYVRGDLAEARKWQTVCAQVKKMFVKPYPIAPQKQVLAWRGICGPDVRAPLRRMTDEETEQLRSSYSVVESMLD